MSIGDFSKGPFDDCSALIDLEIKLFDPPQPGRPSINGELNVDYGQFGSVPELQASLSSGNPLQKPINGYIIIVLQDALGNRKQCRYLANPIN